MKIRNRDETRRLILKGLRDGLPIGLEKIGAALKFSEQKLKEGMAYIQPRIEENQFGGESVTYMGPDAQKHWTRVESYGPKFVENITQALCRDLWAVNPRGL